jgi:glycosyltransferase involved in cell wall biosynthesis
LKLALVTRRYPPLIGGAEKVLSYLAEALAREGAEVTVLTSRAPGTKNLPLREEVSFSGGNDCGRLTVVRLATSQLRFVGTWLYMRSLAQWFNAHSVDLAYVSMLKHDAYVAVEAGLRHGFPVVLRPEGAGETGDLAWQNWGNFGRRIGIRCKKADGFVAISRDIARELSECGYEPARIHPLTNGVPVPEIAWQRRPGWRTSPRAIFVGRLAPEKGLNTLLDAWPSVRLTHPGACLTLIGEGLQRPALEAQARSLGLTLGPGQVIEIPGAVADVTAA